MTDSAYGHYIQGKWGQSSGLPFSSRNPATEEVVWQGHAGEEAEIQAAVEAAKSAFSAWSAITLEKRVEYLEKYRQLLEKSQDGFAIAISKEMGKPLWESRTEIQSMMNKIPISIEAYKQRCPTMTSKQPQGNSITRHKPHGVIAILGPFNFPGHLPNGHIIPALLAGNTIVFKPSELTPGVGQFLIKLWEDCGLPPGVINLVQGGRETGRMLIGHPQINGLFFTGSWETGLILSEQFAKHPDKILALEMGGNNPLVVTQVPDLKAAAFTTIQSAFLTSGQRCTCARRLIVPKGKQGDAFIQELLKMMDTIRIGPYTDAPEPYMGPVISEKVVQYLLTVQDTLKQRHGVVLKEMHLKKLNTALISPGLIDVTNVLQKPDEEIFGPLLQLIRVQNFDDAIAEANNTAYGLTAGLLSNSQEEYQRFFQEVRAGVINWNTPLTGASSSAPFGGVGHSGNHRPSAFYAADYCAYPVASLENASLTMPKQMPPGLEI